MPTSKVQQRQMTQKKHTHTHRSSHNFITLALFIILSKKTLTFITFIYQNREVFKKKGSHKEKPPTSTCTYTHFNLHLQERTGEERIKAKIKKKIKSKPVGRAHNITASSTLANGQAKISLPLQLAETDNPGPPLGRTPQNTPSIIAQSLALPPHQATPTGRISNQPICALILSIQSTFSQPPL